MKNVYTNLKERERLVELGVGESIIVTLNLKKYYVRM
jgi:hypothetical protein